MAPVKERKTVVTTERDVEDGAPGTAEDDAAAALPPLFSKDDAPDLAYVILFRDEPIEEGMIPVRLDPSTTELDIARRFGGGVYRAQGRTSAGKPAKGAGMTQIRIAGAPIFADPESARKYRNRLKQERRAERDLDEEDDGAGAMFYPPGAAAAPPPPAGPTVSEIIALMSSQAQQSAQIMIQMFQSQAAAAQQQHARDLESENRRRQAELEMAREARERDREFFGQILAGLRPAEGAASSTSVLLEGLKLGAQLGGQAAGDPVTAAIENLPEILEAVRETGKAVVSENARGKKPAADDGAAPDEKLTLGGPLGKRALALVARWKAAGLNPEREMAKLIEAGAGGGGASTKRKAIKAAPTPPAKKNGAAGKPKPAPEGSA